jgi:hypothetical protein
MVRVRRLAAIGARSSALPMMLYRCAQYSGIAILITTGRVKTCSHVPEGGGTGCRKCCQDFLAIGRE